MTWTLSLGSELNEKKKKERNDGRGKPSNSIPSLYLLTLILTGRDLDIYTQDGYREFSLDDRIDKDMFSGDTLLAQ